MASCMWAMRVVCRSVARSLGRWVVGSVRLVRSVCCRYGLGGVRQDFTEAGKFYARASDMDNLDATYYLALLHAYGRGFAQDIHHASLLFKKAAEKGHAPSQ